MRNETLSYILRNMKLEKCDFLENNIYYIKKHVRQKIYSPSLGREKTHYTKCEFLIIVDNGIKKGIIYNCENNDLHWYTFHKWRNQGVISNALRTGIIKKVWPMVKTVSCCCDRNENKEEKYNMTKHLASLAGLGVSEETTPWISF